MKEDVTLVRNRLVAVNGEINNLVGSLAKLGADAVDLVKEGLARLKGEREQLQGQLKELDAAKAPHDVVRERAAKFVASWTDIGQLIDDADLAEQRVILQHLVHSLVLTAADKGAKHGTYALRLFPEIGPINPEGGENDRGPNPDAPRKGSGDRAVLAENDVVRQFGEKAPRAEQFSNFLRATLGERLPFGCARTACFLGDSVRKVWPRRSKNDSIPNPARCPSGTVFELQSLGVC